MQRGDWLTPTKTELTARCPAQLPRGRLHSCNANRCSPCLKMHGYCLARDDVDFLLDVTKFKTKQDWGEDPMKEVDTQTKAAFTR